VVVEPDSLCLYEGKEETSQINKRKKKRNHSSLTKRKQTNNRERGGEGMDR
jgi:hypothetical protein